MATNPPDPKTAPPLFAAGLFGSSTAPTTGLFGGSATPATGLFGNAPKGPPLFGAPSPNSAPGAFSPLGQQPPITPLFGSAQGQPLSAPGNLEAGRGGLFSGGLSKPTAVASSPSEGTQANKPSSGSANSSTLGLFNQNAQGPTPSLFASSTTANPSLASSPSNPPTLSFGPGQEGKREETSKKQEAPSLFGGPGLTGSLFGGVQSVQSSTGLGMFGQASKPSEGEKKDEKKQTPGSLFGGMTSSASPDFKNTLAPKRPETLTGQSTLAPTATAPEVSQNIAPKIAEPK